MLTQTQEIKRIFVKTKLFPLLQAINPDITDVRYEVLNMVEMVSISFCKGGEYRINVSADSLAALSRDVLKHF